MHKPSIISRFGTAACWCFASLISFVIFALALSWILFLDSPFQTPTENHGPSAAQLDLVEQTQNRTLGLGAIYAINVPEQTEKWQSLTDVADASGIDFERIDGVLPDDIDKESLPPGLADDAKEHSMLRGYSLGAWKAHMNALEQIIESGVATAAIVEDDIDWDVRLKDQMRDLALATQTLIQPIESNSIFRDLYPGLPTRMAFEDMPAVEMPMSGSPYGDFDVLWLGYCRMVVETHTSETNHIIYRANDSSVPDREWLRNNGFLGHGLLLQDMPEHTRIYHHVRDGLCSLFYAVSASAARKIYHEFSEVLLYAPFDVMLMHYCNLGARPEPGTKESLKCFAATPQLFNHWRSGNNASENIRWSARLNIEKLRTGSEDDFVDSWPDHEQDG